MPLVDLFILLFIIIIVSTITQLFLDWAVGPKISGESYRAEVTPLVKNLVRVAAPKLITQERFTKEDVEAIVGPDPNLDAEMYQKFKKLLRTGKLSEEKLLKEVT